MLPLRTDVAWKESRGAGFLRVGAATYRLDGAPVDRQRGWWRSLQEGGPLPSDDSDFRKFVDILTSLRAFQEDDAWETYGRDFGLALRGFGDKLHAVKVGVVGDPDLVSCVVEQAQWVSARPFDIDDADCIVVVARATQGGIFQEYNRKAFEKQTQALFVAFEPFGVRVGPWVLPGESACYSCMELRRRDNFLNDESALFEDVANEVRDSLPKPFVRTGVSILYVSLLQYLMSEAGNAVFVPAVGHVLDYNWLDGSVASRKLLRHPNCEQCFPHRTPASLWLPGVNNAAEVQR